MGRIVLIINGYTDSIPGNAAPAPTSAANDNILIKASMDEILADLSATVDFGIYWVISRSLSVRLAGVTSRSALIAGRPWPAKPAGEQ